MDFRIIDHDTDDYYKAVALRQKVLRLPFGLDYSQEELASEKDSIHIAGFINDQLIATAYLQPEEKKLKMRGVAIDESMRSKGIGTSLIKFCEQYAIKHEYLKIYCHARSTAINFYLKNGFELYGEPFEENSIPHHGMHKLLRII